MRTFGTLFAGAFAIVLGAAHSLAASYVYVSNAVDGDISMYTLHASGALEPGGRFRAGKRVMPMAVSTDSRFLIAAARSKPYLAYTYRIDRTSGALELTGRGLLAASLPYIFLHASGRYLLGASYDQHLLTVSPVGADGRVGTPVHVIPAPLNAHAIITDRTGRFAFSAHLGADRIGQFVFDAKRGRLSSNEPPWVQVDAGTGPRHLVVSPDNRFLYLLNEHAATVKTFALDGERGTLTATGYSVVLYPDRSLVRAAAHRLDAPSRGGSLRASDLHLTPDGRFLYAAERATGSIAAFAVDSGTGELAFLGSIATERQPRGFRIDPASRFLIVAGENSGMLSVYAIDPRNGALSAIGRYPAGKGANWIEIVTFPFEGPSI